LLLRARDVFSTAHRTGRLLVSPSPSEAPVCCGFPSLLFSFFGGPPSPIPYFSKKLPLASDGVLQKFVNGPVKPHQPLCPLEKKTSLSDLYSLLRARDESWHEPFSVPLELSKIPRDHTTGITGLLYHIGNSQPSLFCPLFHAPC